MTILERAQELNEYNNQLPNVSIGEIVDLYDVWDGNGEIPIDSYCYLLTDNGEDGNTNTPIWLNYKFEWINIDTKTADFNIDEINPENIQVKITDIDFV